MRHIERARSKLEEWVRQEAPSISYSTSGSRHEMEDLTSELRAVRELMSQFPYRLELDRLDTERNLKAQGLLVGPISGQDDNTIVGLLRFVRMPERRGRDPR
jgi:hypothetical protein